MEKKFDFKKFLSNNAIIILIILLALFVGCTTQNFFTETNGKNLLLNVAPRFIIACGVSGCLITKGTDLSAGRQVGLAACFSAMLLQSVDYSARMLPCTPAGSDAVRRAGSFQTEPQLHSSFLLQDRQLPECAYSA